MDVKITDILRIENIAISIEAKDKDVAIDWLVDIAARNSKTNINLDDIKSCLKKREQIRSTAFGKGVAIPHAICPKLNCIISAVGIFKKPIAWADNKPVNIVAVVSGPSHLITSYMKYLSNISQMLANQVIRGELLSQENVSGILNILMKAEKSKNG